MRWVCVFLLAFTFLLIHGNGLSLAGEGGSYLQQGIEDFRDENYEEALESLLRAYNAGEDPATSAYYTGLTYKEMLQYHEAREFLEKALSLNPALHEAYLHLGEVLYGLNLLQEAEEALSTAMEKGVDPPRTMYLLGLIHLKKGSFVDARGYFERVVSEYSDSPVASYARKGLDTLSTIEKKSPLRVVLSYSFQYDDNVLLKPSEEVSGVRIEGEEDSRHVFTLMADYTPDIPGPAGLTASYAFYQSLHYDLNELDIQAHRLALTPSIGTRVGEIDLLTSYEHFFLNNDTYLQMVAIKPSYTYRREKGWELTVTGGVLFKEFSYERVGGDEDRDATNLSVGVQYLSTLTSRGYILLGYTYDSEDTDGRNWDYRGNRVSAYLYYSVLKPLSLRITTGAYLQDYTNTHTVYGRKRKDLIYTATPELVYTRGALSVRLHYSFTRSDSNLKIYDYTRNIYGLGVEYLY